MVNISLKAYSVANIAKSNHLNQKMKTLQKSEQSEQVATKPYTTFQSPKKVTKVSRKDYGEDSDDKSNYDSSEGKKI